MLRAIKPMKKIMIVLCLFGLLIGLVFPVFADYFVVWIPERKIMFKFICMIAGFAVGMFGFLTVKFILNIIDRYYKSILLDKLGIDNNRLINKKNDMLITMKSEFEELLDGFSVLVKKEKENLTALSNTDCLTSLYNHRYFYETINKKLILQCKVITVLFCDIDNFKMINDNKGHQVGDLILCEIAKVMKEVLRDNDMVFRYGGEEFIILLENSTREHAYSIAERIRLNVCT
jgi:GGDEF domain-containing protein